VTYEVTWSPLAEAQLAELWLSTSDRSRVTRAAAAIDAQLARDPHNVGESRAGETRIAFEAPIAVLFHLDDERQEVVILRIWGIR
jgi:plasmid stabilization system protein ParE